MGERSYSDFKSRSVEGYELFFEIEVVLRELITRNLEQQFGKKWLKQALPPDIRKRISDGLEYERSIPWAKLVPHSPLYYSDFPHLRILIEMGGNWTLFAETFRNKDGVRVHLGELEAIRNKIAHLRYLTDRDLAYLRTARDRIVGCIPPTDLKRLMQSAAAHVPITAYLARLVDAIEGALVAMRLGKTYTDYQSEIFDALDQWWFEDAYLGRSTERIRAFSMLLEGYQGLPSGLGQALKKRQWIEEREAVQFGIHAVDDLRQMLTTAERFDA
ncbi:hypothetical protein [Rhizobium sp. Root1203]|uniref:hypothetical protein n=1 Tax=Rhizobium sp. Root1203 TaxID=1736427 RepID=UPI000AF16D35|nr:hypothetical protein [Rhizobium sp. Root1203]